MNKKFVTLLSVAVLSSVANGILADEINLGGNSSTPNDNSGLVVSEKPAEAPKESTAPTVNENLDLGGSVDKKEDKDSTGVVVEQIMPTEQPKEDKPSEELGKDTNKNQEHDHTGVVVEPTSPSTNKSKEEKPVENVGDYKQGDQKSSDSTSDKSKEGEENTKPNKEDTPEVKEQKQKAEDNVGVKEKEEPKPLNVTKEEIKEKPIETNTGYKIVGTNKGKVVVEESEGNYVEKEPYEVGAVKQKDGTIALKDKEGELKVLPNTGTASTIFATIWGFVGLIATFLGKRKVK